MPLELLAYYQVFDHIVRGSSGLWTRIQVHWFDQVLWYPKVTALPGQFCVAITVLWICPTVVNM